jgi:hypothetical protein
VEAVSSYQIAGAAIVALPFLALFAFVAFREGFWLAVGIFAGTGALVAVMLVGSMLLTGGIA